MCVCLFGMFEFEDEDEEYDSIDLDNVQFD